MREYKDGKALCQLAARATASLYAAWAPITVARPNSHWHK